LVVQKSGDTLLIRVGGSWSKFCWVTGWLLGFGITWGSQWCWTNSRAWCGTSCGASVCCVVAGAGLYVTRFNEHGKSHCSPSDVICVDESISRRYVIGVDESISRRYGFGRHWRSNLGLPMYVSIDRKPDNEGVGYMRYCLIHWCTYEKDYDVTAPRMFGNIILSPLDSDSHKDIKNNYLLRRASGRVHPTYQIHHRRSKQASSMRQDRSLHY
jgi:hypothetical protein